MMGKRGLSFLREEELRTLLWKYKWRSNYISLRQATIKEIQTKTLSKDMSFTILETQMFQEFDTKFRKKLSKVSE